VDTLTKAERSRRMSLVRSKDTKPELRVRQIAHKLGYRFRLHQTHLSGKPDLVFKRLQKVIFIHGASGIVIVVGLND
jgi:DNA mismatch endonuclease (patch repair protein)